MSKPIKAEFQIFVILMAMGFIIASAFGLAKFIIWCQPEKHDPIEEEVVYKVKEVLDSNNYIGIDEEGNEEKFHVKKYVDATKLNVDEKITVTRVRRFYKDGSGYNENFKNPGERTKEFVENRDKDKGE